MIRLIVQKKRAPPTEKARMDLRVVSERYFLTDTERNAGMQRASTMTMNTMIPNMAFPLDLHRDKSVLGSYREMKGFSSGAFVYPVT